MQIQDELLWCMLFAYHMALIDKTRAINTYNLEMLKEVLQSRNFKLSTTKTEYIDRGFGNRRKEVNN